MDKASFINLLKPPILKMSEERGYNRNCIPAMIAQAACESAWGESELSKKYHNYFGMKCGSSWTGKSVNMITHEETPAGNVIIKDNFRAFDSVEDGVKGYFDFLEYSRYAPLKSCTDSESYIRTIKVCGWATSSTYIKTLLTILKNLPEIDLTTENSWTANTCPPVFQPGQTVTLQENMAVRKGPGVEYDLVGYANLTADGKKHDKNKNGYLDKGTRADVQEYVAFINQAWIRIPSGWVCSFKDGKEYVK